MQLLHKYASFVKLEHTLFSLPLLFAGALLARKGFPSVEVSLLILIAGGAARVVALALNRLIDRKIDSRNPRTKGRHLASGQMKLYEAWIVLVVSLALYAMASWLISDFCLKISWIPLIGFAVYPYFKRFTKWTHVGLGMVWAFVPLAGFFTLQSSLKESGPVLMLGAFCIFWLAGFDIIYATMDEASDRENGVHSLPAAWGSKRAMKVSGYFHVAAFVLLLLLYGIWFEGTVTVMMLGIIGILLYLEHQFARYVDLAFFQLNAIIGVMIFIFVFTGLKGF